MASFLDRDVNKLEKLDTIKNGVTNIKLVDIAKSNEKRFDMTLKLRHPRRLSLRKVVRILKGNIKTYVKLYCYNFKIQLC
jgi:hypothetical protein